MLTVLFAALALTAGLRQSPPDLDPQLRRVIAASGAEVAVAYRTLDARAELLIDPDKPFHAASTMKVPVMIELFRQVRAGTITLDDPLPIRNEFHSIVDGSPYRLSEGDDSDKAVYAAAGPMTLRQLCEAMITVSSNFAANLLIEKLGVQNIRRAVDAQSDAAMIDVLKRQKFNTGIPAGLPPGTPVAHKTGNITRIHHDAAIVYGPQPYVLVILVRGIQEQKESAALIAAISREIWAEMRPR